MESAGTAVPPRYSSVSALGASPSNTSTNGVARGVGQRRAKEILGPERAVHEPPQRLASLGDGRRQGRRRVDRHEQHEPGGVQAAAQVLDENDLGRQRRRSGIPGALHRGAATRLAHRVEAERKAVAVVERLEKYDAELIALDARRETDALQPGIDGGEPHLGREPLPVVALDRPESVEQSDAGAQQRLVGEQTIADCGLNVGREELQLGACLLLLAVDGCARRDPGQHEAGDQDSESE